MPGPDQQGLVDRARAGSADAFSALVTLHQERLYRFLLSRCHARADAEDAMQEAFISAFRYLDSYNPRWAFSTWLYRIALRELGKIRSRNAALPESPARVADKDEDPLAACIAASQKENLWAVARAVLSEQAFTATWLRYAEDMPVKDVARVMGRPAVWVRVTVHRARHRLADALVRGERKRGATNTAPGTAEPVESSRRARSQSARRHLREQVVQEQMPPAKWVK